MQVTMIVPIKKPDRYHDTDSELQLNSNEGTMRRNKLTIKTNVHHNHFTSGKFHEKAK